MNDAASRVNVETLGVVPLTVIVHTPSSQLFTVARLSKSNSESQTGPPSFSRSHT